MAAPTKKQAITGLVFVGAAALAMVLIAAAFSLAMRLMGVEFDVVQATVIPAVIMFSAGTWAVKRYRKPDGS